MKEITDYLINEVGMRRVSQRSQGRNIDINKFSCVIRIADIHYLFWSEVYKHFSMGVKHENVKGKAGGGFDYWTYVMIPKVIDTLEKASALVESIIDWNYLKVITQ